MDPSSQVYFFFKGSVLIFPQLCLATSISKTLANHVQADEKTILSIPSGVQDTTCYPPRPIRSSSLSARHAPLLDDDFPSRIQSFQSPLKCP